MYQGLVVCVVLALVCVTARAQTNCQGNLTGLTVWTEEPVLVNTTANGKLYTVGGSENPVNVLHLYGTPYEMGQAQGQLLKDTILEMYDQFFDYADDAAAPYLKYLPEFLRKLIVDEGVNAALEFEVLMTHAYVPDYFTQEIQGLADALGRSYESTLRIMMFPELIKAACSIVGAWGQATVDGGLYHLRALDWGTTNPFRQFPTFTVYHPNEGNGHPFATLGWNGFIGALTGYSPYVGAGEKVWIHYNGTDARAGIPWHFLFRDMLQFDENVTAAINRIETAHRTCSIFLGLGDHGDGNFKAVEYSYERVEVFGDDTPFPGYEPTPPQHPLLTDVVYVDKHTQPSSDPCLGSLLQKYYGNIGPQALIDVTALLQTGDMHAAIYDYKNDYVYVSVATQTVAFPPPDPSTVFPSYNRQFIQLDMEALFALQN